MAKQSDRALLVVRLSYLTDETTSPERQREIVQVFAKLRNMTIAGRAEDLDRDQRSLRWFDPTPQGGVEGPRNLHLMHGTTSREVSSLDRH